MFWAGRVVVFGRPDFSEACCIEEHRNRAQMNYLLMVPGLKCPVPLNLTDVNVTLTPSSSMFSRYLPGDTAAFRREEQREGTFLFYGTRDAVEKILRWVSPGGGADPGARFPERERRRGREREKERGGGERKGERDRKKE